MKSPSTREVSAGSGAGAGRFPTWLAALSAAGLFALLQAGFVLVRVQDFDVTAAIGLAKVGVMAAFPTVLGLTLVVLAVRRWHPASREANRRRATRSLLFGLVAALGAWMLIDGWVAGPLVPTGLEVWIEVVFALAVGLAVAWKPPSARFCRRTAWLAAVAVLFIFLPVTDPRRGDAASGDARLPASESPATAPDVVLISIDTLRADRLGAYGSSLGLTPEMDRFAAEGFLFERTVAASPWTVPSVASMLTGLPTIRHGAGLPLGSGQTFLRTPLDAAHVTLAQRLAAAGYRTRAVVANGFLSPEMGMARGFDEFDTPFSRASGAAFVRDIPLARLALALYPVERWGDYRAAGVTDRALEILAEEASEPLFLWLHYIDPHTPFQADPAELDIAAWSAEFHQQQPRVRDDGTVVGEFFAGTANVRSGELWLDATDRGRIEEYYDRAVAYVDSELGRLFAAMRSSGRARPLVAALTADHGEELWDHGHFEHGHDYYREVTRIPLVFWAPGRVPAGRAGGEPVGLVDVPATVLELAGLEPPPPAAPDEGQSLAPRWSGAPAAAGPDEEPGTDPETGTIRFAEGNLYGMPSVLLEEGPWRFILRAHGAGELYHVVDDPRELENRVAEHPELVARYRALLEPRLALVAGSAADRPPTLDAEAKKALRALGYVR